MPQAADVHAEDALLSVFYCWPDLIDEYPWLQPDHLARPNNKVVFRAMLAARTACEPADLIALVERLRRNGELDGIGGPAYLMALAEYGPRKDSHAAYARAILDSWRRRQFRDVGATVVHEHQTAELAVLGQTVRDAVDTIEAVAAEDRDDVPAVSKEVLTRIALRRQEANAFPADCSRTTIGYSTGFSDLDSFTGGLIPGQLVVLAARPGRGKTTLALQIAATLARNEIPALYASLEMGREELWTKLVCSHYGVDAEQVLTGRLLDIHGPDLEATIASSYACLRLFSTGDLTPARLHAEIRRTQRQFGCKLAVVDYLQLMESGTRGQTRNEQVATITRGLKTMAMDLEVCVLAISQLNRLIERRDDKTPLLSDLRDSGAIEQDANVVFFLHQNTDKPGPGMVEAITAKARLPGRTGTAFLEWSPALSRFDPVEPEINRCEGRDRAADDDAG